MDKNYISQLKDILMVGALTQVELARRLGITFAALNRWLQGHAVPQPKRLVVIDELYKEIVGYPSFTTEQTEESIRRANKRRQKGLWDKIARHANLQEELLLEHTYNSTAIEGTTFTKRQTEGVIFNKAVIPNKSLTEHLEVTHHAAVLKQIFQKRLQGPITEQLIKTIHAGLLQGIREDAGHYSKHPRAIRGVDIALTHPADIPEEMKSLLKQWAAKPRRKSLKDLAQFHVNFELIHPFGDGNGRTGRLLLVLQCLQDGFPPVVIENARKIEYYDVLEYAQKKSDGPFICFLADEMDKTSRLLKKYI